MYYKAGKDMIVSDGFNHNPDYDLGGGGNQEQILLPHDLFQIRKIDCNLEATPSLRSEIRRAQDKDNDAQEIIQAILGKKSNLVKKRLNDWSVQDGLLLYKGKIYVPNKDDLCRQVISVFYENHRTSRKKKDRGISTA